MHHMTESVKQAYILVPPWISILFLSKQSVAFAAKYNYAICREIETVLQPEIVSVLKHYIFIKVS